MLAAILHGKRDLRLQDWPDLAPGPGEVRVRVGAAGICGSDLHYYQHGANGPIILREPLVLGHEMAGTVESVGPGVEGLHPGRKVAINPSRPCRRCADCIAGNAIHCRNGTFMGSAMRFPHVQGGFRQFITCAVDQLHPVAEEVSLTDLAFAEPLAVCLHAVARAGNLFGKRVLVTGSGPIGLLIVMLARQGGAQEVVSTDLSPWALDYARAVGVDLALDVSEGTAALEAEAPFDLAFECSGHPTGVAAAIRALRSRGVLVQVGTLAADVTAPLGQIVLREIDYRGTFRFDAEFGAAVALIASGKLDFRPMLSHRLPLAEATRALEIAGDRTQAMKVQIVFE